MPGFDELWVPLYLSVLTVQDGFEHICARVEDGEKFYAAYHKILTKLSAVETKYVKGLNSLKQLFADAQSIPTGTLQKGWSVKEAEFLKYVDDRTQWTKDLEELGATMLEQKKSFAADRRALEERGKAHLRELANLESKCDKARKAYLDGIKAFQEASETYKGIAAEKVKARAKAEKNAQKKKKESQELDSQYYESVKELKLGQDSHYTILMPELLKDFETIEGIRIDNMRAIFETYLAKSSHLGPNMSAQHHRLSLATEAINTRADLDEYVLNHKPTSPPPPRARYESHDGIIREITDSIAADAVSPRPGAGAKPKKGIKFGGSKPKKPPTEGLQSQRMRTAAGKANPRLDSDSANVSDRSTSQRDVKVAKVETSSPSVQINETPSVHVIESAHEEKADGHEEPVDSVVALYDYNADEEGELTFVEGDIIQVLTKDPSGWWRGRTANGEEGDFPSNYVGPVGSVPEGTDHESSSSSDHHVAEAAAPATHEPAAVAPVLPSEVKEEHHHHHHHHQEVAHVGADGGEGVAEVAEGGEGVAAAEAGAEGSGEYDEEEKPIDSTFVALYDYEAEESGELTILKDQVLYVFTERGGWFYGRNDSGQVGLFPSNYVESTGTQ